MKNDTQWNSLKKEIVENHHHLFMVNKFGQTPLDIAIQEKTTTVSLQKSFRVAKADVIFDSKARHIDRSEFASVNEINVLEPGEELVQAPEKARFLIDHMQNFGPECSLKYVKRR